MGTVSNLKIGDCDIFLNEVALGFTKGGIDFTIGRKTVDLTVDQFGDAPLDKIIVGVSVKAECNMAEYSKELLKTYMQEARWDNAGLQSKLGIGVDAGVSLAATAKVLRLHPRNRVGTDQEEDIFIYKAVQTSDIKLGYQVDKQDVIKAIFEGLIDVTRINGYRLGSIGDNAIS